MAISKMNRRALEEMYDEKDAKRLTTERKEELRLTNGPGAYILEIDGVRAGSSKKKGPSFGKKYISFSFKVIEAHSVIAGGVDYEPVLQAGDQASHVLIMDRAFSEKEKNDIICAAKGLSPVYVVEHGKHEGKRIFFVDPDQDDEDAFGQEDFRDSSLYDGDAKRGIRISCIIRPRKGKPGTEHADKTFYNASFYPSIGGKLMQRFPSMEELMNSAMAEFIEETIKDQHEG